jgi:N-acetylneuraminic acid mutarotase
MPVWKRVGFFVASATFPLFLLGQEPIENWPAPPFWSARAPVAAPSDGSVAPLGADVIPSPPLPFIAINPCRIADTRGLGFTGQAGPPALSANTLRTFQIGGTVAGVTTQCGIPLSAQAVSFQFSVTGMNTAGNLIAWPEGPAPTTSVLNWNASSVAIGNGIVVPVSAMGGLNVQLNGPAGATTQLIIDVNGYYGGSVVTSVTPGTGLTGGGTGAVTVGIAAGGVGSTELATGAVTSAKIGANAVTAGAIASGQVVKDLNGVRDSVTVAGSGVITVGTAGSTITVGGVGAPTGSFVLGNPGDTTIIGAGFTETGMTQDFWLPTATAGAPTARAQHTAVWTGTRMIVWGGDDGPTLFNTGGRYDPVGNSWSATATMGAPSARTRHTAVWTGTKMIVWGGDAVTGPGRLNTGGQYDPVGNSWSATTTTGAPTGRDRHTAVWADTSMIVWGGSDGVIDFNTGAQYDPVGNSWTTPTQTGGAPTARSYHTAIWTGTSMIVWGGSAVNTGGQYYPIGDIWAATTTTGAPTGRYDHTAIWTGTKMIVWGGYGGAYLNTGGQYDPVGNSWSATATAGAPTGRSSHTAVWTGTKMIVWGGSDGPSYFNTGGQYDPAGNSWTSTATAGAAARGGHTAVWTGKRMIVWGGYDGVALNIGGRYTILSLYAKN